MSELVLWSHCQSPTKLWGVNRWTQTHPTGSRFKWTLLGGALTPQVESHTISPLFWMLSSSLWLQAAHKLIFTWFVQKTISSHSEIKSCIHPVLSWQCSKIIPMQILQPAITHSSRSPGPITFSEKVASFFLRSMIPQLLHRVILLKKSSSVLWDCNAVSCFLCPDEVTKSTILS